MSKVAKKQKVCKAAESVAQVVQNTQLQVAYHFPCPVYLIERPDFLEAVNAVSEEALEVQRKDQNLIHFSFDCFGRLLHCCVVNWAFNKV